MKNAKEIEAYNRGFAQGLIQGRVDERVMKEDADGCTGCAFVSINEWEMPCAKCKRNSKDYWRTKEVEQMRLIDADALIERFKELKGSDTLANMFVSG